MIPPKQSVGWQFRDVAYPPRFSSLEAAQSAVNDIEYCKHEERRMAQTYPPDGRSMTQRKMIWCGSCGKLMDDFTWKIPTVEDLSGKSPTLSVPCPE